MVDRGGLNYPIRVRDEFSKTTALFRSELRKSKKEFRDFQKALKGNKSATKNIKAQTTAVRELAKAQKQLATATKSAVKPLTDEERASRAAAKANKDQARALAELARQQKVRERTAIALRNAQNADLRREKASIKAAERKAKADRKTATARNVERQARLRNAMVIRQETIALKRLQILKEKAFSQFGRGDFFGGTKTLRRARAMEKSLKGQVGSAQKLLFTFRRLVGTLAIFTLARKGFQAFTDLVKTGIKFNDTIAVTQLGIAGLVITLGDVRDEFGNSASSVEQLNLALGIAREQTFKLRQDSLRTVATFQQLLETFQVSVGPGLAAGLDLDEVRQLTVDISQAASALGVPQNQLAEEVRSLLSGTIQARTTRIATALGISNEDIRRLKELGTLFDFLQDKFEGFDAAAKRLARETLSGISTLVKGLVQEILGNAAEPLFKELIALGNDLFDNFLSIRDAAENIRPSPEVVAAFQQIFDAIKRSVEAFRELGTGTAINTLDAVLAGIAFTIDFISGVVTQLVSIFATVSGAAKEFAEFIGLSSDEAGAVARFLGKWLVNFLLIKKVSTTILSTLKNMSPKMLSITGSAVAWAAAFFAIAKGVEFILEKIFGIDLGIKDTIQLIALGLFGAWVSVSEVVQSVAVQIVSALSVALKTTINAAKKAARKGKGFIDALFGDSDEEQQAAATKRLAAEKKDEEEIASIKAAGETLIAKIKADAAQKQLDLEKKIAKIIGDRAGENAKGPGFREGFDPKKTAKDAAAAAQTFVSTAQRPISDLGEALARVNEELVKAEQLFAQAQRSAGAGGVAGQVESIFNKEEIASAERLLKIRSNLADTERAIIRLREASGVSAEREIEINNALLTDVEDRDAAVKALNITKSEGGLVSALRDQLLLQNAINTAEQDGLDLAILKAATLAASVLPALERESALLASQVAAERAKTAAIVARVGDRELALVAAQSAVDLAKQELEATIKKNQAELDSLLLEASVVTAPKELAALNAIIDALLIRRDFEVEILSLRLRQLEAAEAEAELVANGSLTEGLREGFQQFAEEFSSTFQAGINIARGAIDGLARFASQAIVDAFDPTKEVDIVERFARLMQQIAQVILQQLIQLAIAKALIKTATGEGEGQDDSSVSGAVAVGAIRVSTETTIAAIKINTAIAIAAIKAASGGGFSQGGLVGLARGGIVPHFSSRAQGLARGGRPAHIPASDTIPAWLTPGEFVMNKGATSSFLSTLEAMNGGKMSVVGSTSAEVAGPSTGMASGGLVADRIANAREDSEGGGTTTVVVPAIVATDREMDTLTAGGRNAMLAFMAEEAGNINSLLDRSNRQG